MPISSVDEFAGTIEMLIAPGVSRTPTVISDHGKIIEGTARPVYFV